MQICILYNTHLLPYLYFTLYIIEWIKNKVAMDKLFERHNNYISGISCDYVRDFANVINWDARLIIIKGSKGVGKSTLMLQYIKNHFDEDDRHVLYCSADTGYFSNHTLVDTADTFAKMGGKYLFIDEVHKYDKWSNEIKEIYDLHRELHLVLSGSSLIQINDGDSDLSRRMICYDMPGLSLREYIRLETGIDLNAITLEDLLEAPNKFCSGVRKYCRPLEYFKKYLKYGYYPFYFESKTDYHQRVENVVNYLIDVELTKHRGVEIGNTRSIKALLQVISQMVPYDVDIAKLSRAIGITRPTLLKYLGNIEEANLIHRLFTDLKSITDLQKPDKILLDNPNLLYALSPVSPEIGTARETFIANQLVSAGHQVEYAGYKSGDFKIDGNIVIEVGGAEKGFSQLHGQENSYVAADDIESALNRKIPLWAFGFLY